MARPRSGLWVNGWNHEYAVGRQERTGRIGAIFHEPGASQGAGVVLSDEAEHGDEPWVCSCDSLPAAVFSAANHGGGGWTWRRHLGSCPTELYFWFEVPVSNPVNVPPLGAQPAKAVLETLVGDRGWKLIAAGGYESHSPFVSIKQGAHFARYCGVAEAPSEVDVASVFEPIFLRDGSCFSCLAVVTS